MAASVTTGVMKPLLAKLANLLLGEEYKELTGVRKQVSLLKDEISAMQALLEKMELMDKPDPSAKNWRDHVREMSYDMENSIDELMHNIEGADAGTISNRIEELKVLALEANALRQRYKIDDFVDPSPAAVPVEHRVPAIYKEAAGLVGIDGPREELVTWLIDSEKNLKVVSVVGFGGSGKTTLAKQVYGQIGGQFNFKAILSVSQRPDLKSLLIGLHRKLGVWGCSHANRLQDIIDRLKEHLKRKRYFILVDDLWDQSAWNILCCAFPENSNGSRVMVTTRLDEVAVMACHNDRGYVYRMKHLNEQDSRRLFFNRAFGSEIVCPPQFKGISAEILKKCAGLPLAIITVASLLASDESRSLSEWESINNSLSAMFATEPTLEEMRGILNLCYLHLPVHLRPCFLYLGIYPEDREVLRDDLVRQWIAEGFIYNLHGLDLDDVGKSYFNELINRSLIQLERTQYGEVLSCRVHDMILDMILSKSTEDNFMSAVYDDEGMAKLRSCEYKVRRFSLKSSADCSTSETYASSMSQVRSYARFGAPMCTPLLTQFKYLRVLLFVFPDIYQWGTTVDLTAIGHLFLLRYLKVLTGSAGVALPAEIQGLVHLETLELVCQGRQSFPSDIASLANLIHLILPVGTVLPKGFRNMKSLCTLHCSALSESSLEDIMGLSELNNLKELKLSAPYVQPATVEHIKALVSSITMLRDLKHLSLSFHNRYNGSADRLDSLTEFSPRLEVLDLGLWEFSRVPKWIGKLRFLRILQLRVLRLTTDELRVFGVLPFLGSALFQVPDVSENKLVVGMGLFPVLEDLSFNCNEDVTAYLSFEAGAMPKLQSLTLIFGWKEWRGAAPAGMESLPCLRRIVVWPCLTVGESSKDEKDVRVDVESAFKSVVRLHTMHPSVTIL